MPISILIVDDSTTFRYVTRRLLQECLGVGSEYTEASDGVEAVEKALALSPDLIIMDFSMPRLNGIEASRQIKQKTLGIPVILYTLHQELVGRFDVKAAGISAIVGKNAGHESLVAEARRLLKVA